MEKGGTYVVKTKFGWTLNGPMGRFGQSSKQRHYIRIGQSEDLISKLLDQFFNFEFSESLADLKIGMSQEDKKALSVFEESVHSKDGQYEVEIPWKNYPPCLPNNSPVAEHRLKLLKKKLTRTLICVTSIPTSFVTWLTKNMQGKFPGIIQSKMVIMM